jgi:hypothetical protein
MNLGRASPRNSQIIRMTIRETLQQYYPDQDIEGLRETGRFEKDGKEVVRLDAALREKGGEGEWVVRSFEIVVENGMSSEVG